MTDAVDLAKRVSLAIVTAEQDASRLYRQAIRRKEPTTEAFLAIYDALQKVKAVCSETIARHQKGGQR